MRRQRWLRRALPQWHAKEKDFREWYRKAAQEAAYYLNQPDAYERVVELLNLPEVVTGYREVRYPKINEAHQQANALMQSLKETPDQKTAGVKSTR